MVEVSAAKYDITPEFPMYMRGYAMRTGKSIGVLDRLYCRALCLRVDGESLLRGALLHDFFLYDWHTVGRQYGLHGFTHPATALKHARQRFRLSHKAENVIASHMWPLTLRRLPRCKEAAAVCLIDKCCSLAETFRLAKPIPALPQP